jgi:hypothetical protein
VPEVHSAEPESHVAGEVLVNIKPYQIFYLLINRQLLFHALASANFAEQLTQREQLHTTELSINNRYALFTMLYNQSATFLRCVSPRREQQGAQVFVRDQASQPAKAHF